MLPLPYRTLMSDPSSPILDFYPESFTVDMNGKRWPWEAVVLLPFIDSVRLVAAARVGGIYESLTEEERRRNEFGEAVVMRRGRETVPYERTEWAEGGESTTMTTTTTTATPARRRASSYGGIRHPLPGFPTLREAPVEGLVRKKIGLNVFGMRSRYRTAVLRTADELPPMPDLTKLGKRFVGTVVHFRYPLLQEGFVAAVSDRAGTVRGPEGKLREWTSEEVEERERRLTAMYRRLER